MEKRLSQSTHREVVIIGTVCPDKANGPPNRCMSYRLAELTLCINPKIGQDA
jgi:hypothetical protein